MRFQKISMPTPSKVNVNSKGEGGIFSKALFFDGKYDTKMGFQEGWGLQTKKPSIHVGGVYGYFLEYHNTLFIFSTVFSPVMKSNRINLHLLRVLIGSLYCLCPS